MSRDDEAQRILRLLEARPASAHPVERVADVAHDGQTIRFVRSREGRLGVPWAIAADCEAAFGATLTRLSRRLAARVEHDDGAFARAVLASAAWGDVAGRVELLFGPALFGVAAETSGLAPAEWVRLLSPAFWQVHLAEVARRGEAIATEAVP